MSLPLELINLILYKYGGLEHPTAKIIKDRIKQLEPHMRDLCDRKKDEYEVTYNEYMEKSAAMWLVTRKRLLKPGVRLCKHHELITSYKLVENLRMSEDLESAVNSYYNYRWKDWISGEFIDRFGAGNVMVTHIFCDVYLEKDNLGIN